VWEAANHGRKCLKLLLQVEDTVRIGDEVFDHEVELDTFRSIGWHRVGCLLTLGMCSQYASQLKPPGDEYNEDLRKEMHPSAVIKFERLDEAGGYLQRALDLAVSHGFDDHVPRISEALGLLHCRRAQHYYESLKDFKDSMPRFRANFTDQNGNKCTEVTLLANKNCGNMYHEHWHVLTLLKDGIIHAYSQFPRVPDLSPSSSNSSPAPNPSKPFELVPVTEIRGNWRNTGVADDQCLTDELLEKALRICLCGLVKSK